MAQTVASGMAGAADAATIPDRVRREIASLTAAERQVARALLHDSPVAGLETVARFARRAGTSGPTVLRLVGRLGFGGYPEFQDALRAEIRDRMRSPLSRHGTTRPGDGGDLCDRMSEAIRRNVEIAARGPSREDLALAASLLSDPTRGVLCAGGRFGWTLAAYLHHDLRELRPGVRAIRDGSAVRADDLLDLREGDVLVVFAFRRHRRDVLELAHGAASRRALIVLITDPWLSPVASPARVVVTGPVGLPTAFDSGVAGLAVVEILAAAVVEASGQGSRDRLAELERLREPFDPVS